MSASSTAARLAFHGFGEPETPAPTPSPTRARVDAACEGHGEANLGPSKHHRFHGAIRLGRTSEIRVSTQSPRITPSGARENARLVVRLWHQKPDGSWWPVAKDPGITIHAPNATAFLAAVSAACAAMGRQHD